jgi:hypothetical protein
MTIKIIKISICKINLQKKANNADLVRLGTVTDEDGA